ncbi:MAG: sensor histidine kinase [Pseudolabrys sp.]
MPHNAKVKFGHSSFHPGLYETGSRANILLGIEDITERLILEGEKDDLLRQKDILLEELQHRVANSLQIIASIIMMKARAVESEEARRHLQETHQRVMSVAAVQQQLYAAAPGASVELEPYLTKLCEALGQSMVGDNRAIALKVRGDGKTATSRDAESLGLIVTELVINAIKHAFNGRTKDGQITVTFDVFGNGLEALGHRQRNWHAGRRLCPTKNWAWHRHRQRAR